MAKEFDLSGRVAVVTGGSKGIGFGLATYLAEAGANVVLASRHLDEGRAAAAKIERKGTRAMAVEADVRDVRSCERIVSETVREFGTVDILVNCAGTNIRKPLVDFTEEDWDAVLDTNLKGLFFCSQFAAREMIKQGKGRIINISSLAAQTGVPLLGPYCASKGGITQLTKVCALEWARYGIRVNAIAPPYIKTPLTEQWLSDPQRYQAVVSRSPLKRLGEIKDLKGLLLLLASDESDYITGQTFFVDGGFLSGWSADWR